MLERGWIVDRGRGIERLDSAIARAGFVRAAVGARARIVYDRSKPDGTPQKLLDIGLIRSLGWQPRLSLADGLKSTYQAFVEAAARQPA